VRENADSDAFPSERNASGRFQLPVCQTSARTHARKREADVASRSYRILTHSLSHSVTDRALTHLRMTEDGREMDA